MRNLQIIDFIINQDNESYLSVYVFFVCPMSCIYECILRVAGIYFLVNKLWTQAESLIYYAQMEVFLHKHQS